MSQQLPSWSCLNVQIDCAGLPQSWVASLQEFWQTPPDRPAQHHLLLRPGTMPAIPAAAADHSAELLGRPVAVHALGDELWLDTQVYASFGAEQTQVVVSPGEGHGAGLSEAFLLLLTEVLRVAGWLPLHAAAVGQAGHGVAITGDSGAGKSTATLRLAGLAHLGVQAISEDRTFWHPQTGQVVGLDRHLRAYQDSVQRFAPQLLAQALRGPRDAKGKLLLPLVPPPGPATLVSLVALGEARALSDPDLSGPDLSGPERVRLAWAATGVPLTHRARLRVQAGVTRLIPLIHPTTVTRDQVLDVVLELLAGAEASATEASG